MTLNGSAVSGNAGTGIDSDGGTLALNNSTVSGNTGTGISNLGTLTLNGSDVIDNMGRGISNSPGSVLILNNSTVSGNTGGGISSAGTVTLNNSTVSGNTGYDGGGLHISSGGTLTLNNSTVSGNRAEYGGGIDSDGTLALNNSTVTGNTARFGGGIDGGGTLQKSILVGNVAISIGPDCHGAIGSAGYNLVGDTSGCTFTPTTGDLTHTDPLLGPLEGSPGWHPLLPGSPAINAGNPAGCADHLGNPLTTDQRGAPRVEQCDIGAYEAGLVATKQVNGTFSPAGLVTYRISLSNIGGGTDLTNVSLTDTLPISITYVADSFSATNGTGGESDGVITWGGTVFAGTDTIIAFSAVISEEVPLCSVITNTAVINVGGSFEFEQQVAVIIGCQVCDVTKHANNPIVTVGADGSWDDDDVWGPVVLKEGDSYKMWYTGDDGSNPSQVGLATSADGIIWTKEAANPVLTPGASGAWDAEGVTGPSVIFEGGLYKMWYSGYDSDGVARIGYATSSDGVAWTKSGDNPVLDVGASGSWEDEDVLGPTVIKEGGSYHMWYRGYDGLTARIGHAASSDGVNWAKDSANPVLDIGPPGDWDWLQIYSPNVVAYNDVHLLWYSGETLPPAWQTGRALSSNGTDWTRGEMLIPEGAPGTFDSNSADYPSVIMDGAQFKIWYSGLDDNYTYNIGYATAEVCAAGVPLTSTVYLPIALKGYDSKYPCPAYYKDDFSDPGSGWYVDNDSNRKYAYTGGQYQIWLKKPSWWAIVTSGAKATDFTAAVSARRVSGSSGGYGIFFGSFVPNEVWGHWYEVRIGSNNYRISKYENGWWTHLQNWTTSGHIKTGTSWNRLKVIREGDSIALYINDQHLATVTDSSITGLRRVGLLAFSSSSALDARFDNFALYPASCGVDAAGVGFEMGEPGIQEGPVSPE
jgi:uncharacterized repeat protein (TIGR01451 family)